MKKNKLMLIFLGIGLSASLAACGSSPSAEDTRKAAIDAATPAAEVAESSVTEDLASASDQEEAVIVPSQDQEFTGEHFTEVANQYYMTVDRGPNATIIDEKEQAVNIFLGSRNPSDEFEYIEMSLIMFENSDIAKAAFDATLSNPMYAGDGIAFEQIETTDGSKIASILIQDGVYAVIVQRNNVFYSIETSPGNESEVKKILKDFAVDIK